MNAIDRHLSGPKRSRYSGRPPAEGPLTSDSPPPRVSPVRWVEARLAASVDTLYRLLSRTRFTRLPWAVIQTFSRAQGALLSGSMAYYTFLSLLPLLLIAIFFLGTLSQGNIELRETFIDAFERVLPGIEGNEIIDQLIRSRVSFGVLGVLTVAYAGSGFVGSLTACLNRMWNVAAGRNPLSQKLVNLAVVLLLGVVLLGSVAATVWVGYLTRVLLGSPEAQTARWIELLASPVSLFAVLLILSRMLPARPLTIRSQVPGAVAGTLGVELLKRGFTYWAHHSAGMGALPRSLFSFVLLLAWMGFLGQVILYGAALNVVLERRRRGVPLAPADSAAAP